MAELTAKQYRMEQLTQSGDLQPLHPETDADLVGVEKNNGTTITDKYPGSSTNVQDALKEVYNIANDKDQLIYKATDEDQPNFYLTIDNMSLTFNSDDSEFKPFIWHLQRDSTYFSFDDTSYYSTKIISAANFIIEANDYSRLVIGGYSTKIYVPHSGHYGTYYHFYSTGLTTNQPIYITNEEETSTYQVLYTGTQTLSDTEKSQVLGNLGISFTTLSGSNINKVGTPSVSASTSAGVTTLTFDYLKGATGAKGDTGATGNGISSISKTSTSGLIDTYTITYTSGAKTTYTVTNGSNGSNGTNGLDVFYSSATATSSTTSITTTTLTIPTGHSVNIGDLIIANSLLFYVSAINGTTATVEYKASLKGADGLTTKINLNSSSYTQSGGTITLPNLLEKSKITLSGTVLTIDLD